MAADKAGKTNIAPFFLCVIARDSSPKTSAGAQNFIRNIRLAEE
jgi:hypothetical protein